MLHTHSKCSADFAFGLQEEQISSCDTPILNICPASVLRPVKMSMGLLHSIGSLNCLLVDIANSSRFRSSILDGCNETLTSASKGASSHRVGELRFDPAVVRQWENYSADWTADVLNSRLKMLLSQAVVSYVPR